MGLIPSLKMASSGEQPTAHGERGQLGGLHKMRQPHLSRKMIIDVRKYMPAMRRTCAEMVLENGLKQLASGNLWRKEVPMRAALAEMHQAIKILRKESTAGRLPEKSGNQTKQQQTK